jgi:lipoate-protein ligase A
MKLLDLSLDRVSENLALDEALLEMAEAETVPTEALRLWESHRVAVVLGRSSKVREEVDLDACRRRSIPVLRRCSGGTSVLIGPGCLMYAVVLSYQRRPELRLIEQAHRFVLERVVAAVSPLVSERVEARGTSDLAIGDRKFSGNSLRCRRNHLLYHGTILYAYPLSLLDECLLTPPRQPEYRLGRSHGQFVANVPVSADALRAALIRAWSTTSEMRGWPRESMRELAARRYEDDAWNFRR